jgi:hypothetical protein
MTSQEIAQRVISGVIARRSVKLAEDGRLLIAGLNHSGEEGRNTGVGLERGRQIKSASPIAFSLRYVTSGPICRYVTKETDDAIKCRTPETLPGPSTGSVA